MVRRAGNGVKSGSCAAARRSCAPGATPHVSAGRQARVAAARPTPPAAPPGQPSAASAWRPDPPASRGAAPSARRTGGVSAPRRRAAAVRRAARPPSQPRARAFCRLYALARAESACSCSALGASPDSLAGSSARTNRLGCGARTRQRACLAAPRMPQRCTHALLAAAAAAAALLRVLGGRRAGAARKAAAAVCSRAVRRCQRSRQLPPHRARSALRCCY